MSTVIHKPLSDGSPSGGSFSYAQAAKGRTPSIPSTLASGKTPSESDDLGVRKVSALEPKNTPIACPKAQTEELVGNSREGAVAKSGTEPVSTPSEQNSKMIAPELQPNAEGQVHTPPSIPPSPSSGTASTSTLPKEDEALSSANGSSDSTWEKLSQGSQNGNKTSEKPENDKEQTTSQAWDEEPTTSSPTSLKEAPPPAVNVWQYRKELADAKAKTMSASLQIPKPQNHTSGNAGSNNGIKPSENPSEMRKQDTKKRGKNISGQPEEKQASGKEVTKVTDTKPRSVEEGSEKGARRASRNIDADKFMPAAVAAPPPPGDATSWPTPDSAQGEEKKKAHERVEKGEKEKTPASKPHGREKWMPVPYVPTAIFNTPLPAARRGGRASRGGRDAPNRGHSTIHGSSGPDKPPAGPSDGSVFQSMANSSERGRADPSSFKNSSGSFKAKRAVSAGPSTVREQRKITDAQAVDRVKETVVGPAKANQNPGPSAGESRRTSTATQTDDGKARRFSSTNGGQQTGERGNTSIKGSQLIGERDDRFQKPHLENPSNARPTGPERRNESSVRQADNTRDFQGHMSNRDRGEGRGRGSYRGRANHGYPNSSQANGQNFSHGHPSQSSASAPHQISKTQNSHERHASQSQATPYNQSHSTSRNFRSGNRAQPLQHSATYSRFPNGSSTSHPGAPPLAPLQTDLANAYGYHTGSQGVMSAITYNPYYEQVSLYGMVTVQMEYYFSVDNLCKDLFLRGQMDSQGFVFLSVLAGFNRIKMLTQEMELIRYVCINSQHIEFRQGLDGIDRIRKRDGWQQWVLNKEDRDPSAQNDGSVQSPHQRVLHSQTFDVAQALDNHAETNKQFSSSSHSMDEGMFRMSNGAPPPFVPVPSASANSSNMTEGPLTQTPLSAAVPDFAPSAPPPTEQALTSTNHGPLPTDPTVSAASAFTDDQVESLMIVVRKPVNPSASPPFPPASSRTLSNGSIDGRTNNEALSKFEEHQPKLRIEDGESHVGETPKAKRSWSPFSLASTSRRPTYYASPVFWVKDKDTPIDSLPDDLTHESYHAFRRNALLQRKRSTIGNCHRDMDILYQFWSHFLIRNFNTRMYEEFRRIAFEDAIKQGSTVGIKNLVQYYAESILGQKTISDEIARDFVDLVKDESSDRERPAFDKLRAAWRNGAFNMKNRKKIDKILDVDLKAELER